MKKFFWPILAISVFVSIACTWKNEAPTKRMAPVELKPYSGRSIVFYNVENLFDTIDDADVIDEDFTPTGKLKWDSKRYQIKLNHIVEAVTINLTENPMLIGFAEVENANVVMDVARTGRLAQTRYYLAHKDSPDARGIDCALLYDIERFQPEMIVNLPVTIDSIPNFKTRDILYVKGKMYGGKTLHVFVNHWPSRRGGEKESEIKRIRAAEVAKAKIDEILKQDPKANIVLMGDFNDHPTNVSIEQTLGAKNVKDKKALLVNLLYDDQVNKLGTHNYNNEWGVLDQFIVSKSLYKGKGKIKLKTKDAVIVKDDRLLYTTKEGMQKPSTTYGGDKYYGGYSDHLPIQLQLK